MNSVRSRTSAIKIDLQGLSRKRWNNVKLILDGIAKPIWTQPDEPVQFAADVHAATNASATISA
jgi:hypothetical protein